MATPFTLTNYSGTIEVEPALKAAGSDYAHLFAGISVGFKIASDGKENPVITVGSLSKKDIELVGERAAAELIADHLVEALGGVATPAK